MRTGASVLGAALVFVAAALVAPVAGAAPITSCTSTTGTVIAVDYSHWSGPIVRGCDTSNPKRGIDLLTDTGFTTSGDQHDGPQFLCRIGNNAFHGGTQYPTPAQDACVVTPPASAYWSYWLAPAGQNYWSYSQLGAYSQTPKKGEVELWIFGGTNVAGTKGTPTCSPASLRAGGSATHCSPVPSSGQSTTTSGTKSSKHDGGTNGGSSDGGGSNAGGSTDGGGSSRGSTAAAHGGSAHRSAATGTPSSKAAAASSSAAARRARSASASSTAAVGGASGSSGPAIVDAKPASKQVSPAGSPVPLVIGVGLAIVLGAGAGFTMWRRRSSE